MRESRRAAGAGLAACGERRRRAGHVLLLDTDRGTPGAVRLRSGRSLHWRRSHARGTTRGQRRRALGAAVVRRRRAASVSAWSSIRRLRPHLQERLRHVRGRIAANARARRRPTWPPSRSSDSLAAWSGSARSGGSTFIIAGTQGEVPVERSVLGLFGEARWNAGDRADASRRAFAANASIVTRCPAIRTAFTPRPDFPDDTVVSVNPKIAATWLVAGDAGPVARLDAPARRGRHRHSSARCVRDRVHRQQRAEAGAQPERRDRRHAGARRRRAFSSMRPRSTTATTT